MSVSTPTITIDREHQSVVREIEARDVADEGLSVVYTPASEEPLVDIIFVHGLQGHPRRTWYRETASITKALSQERVNQIGSKQHVETVRRSLKNVQIGGKRKIRGIFWPADLLPYDCPKARIVTFGYNSKVTILFKGTVNQNNVFAHAKNLLYALNRLRSNYSGRPLIFVAHSMGGIIVKDVLRRARGDGDPRLRDISNSTRGILFLGTPHRGSPYSNIAESVRRVVSTLGFDTNSRSLRALNFNSPELEVCHEEFNKIWREQNLDVRTFHEGHGLKGIKGLNSKVVPDFSASLDDTRQQAQYIDANHMDMCRFVDRNDEGYQQVGGELRLLVEKLDQEKTLEKKRQEELLSQDEEKEGSSSLSTEELACLRSLCFSGMESRRQSIYPGLDRTCQWFFDCPEYRSWIDIESQAEFPGLLWIKGKPGAGKSTLMKATLQRIDRESDCAHSARVAFFFSSLGSRLENTLLGLFRSLTYQLLQRHRSLLPGFVRLYRQKMDMYGPDWDWQRQELEDYFSGVISTASAGPLFIIIDALDECDEASARELIMFFEDLTLPSYRNRHSIRICVSSRYFPNISAEQWTYVHMDDHNEPDIRLYVERRLRFNITIPGFLFLVKKIIRKAAGVFLWVVLVVKSLVKAIDSGEPLSHLEQILDDVPEQLNDLIRQLISSIAETHRREALRIIQWILFTSRPLGITELRYALTFGRDLTYTSQAEVEGSATFIETESQMEKLIRSRTRGLVEVKRNSQIHYDQAIEINSLRDPEIAQFIHESVKHVLLHHGGLQILDNTLQYSALAQSQYYIAKTCVAYLSISELGVLPKTRTEPHALGSIQASLEFDQLIVNYPFLEYTVKEVFHHARDTTSNDPQYSGFSRYLMKEMQQKFDVWRYLNDLYLKKTFRQVNGPSTTFAHIAVEYNMIDWVVALIQQAMDINILGGRFHTLIQTAAAMGHEDLVEILLDHGADINLRGGRHENVLTAAAYYGNEKILKSILQRKPNVNALGGEYFTALQASASSLTGDEKIVQLLLDAKAEVNIRGGRHGSALQAAAYKGNEHTLRLLLDAGANVNEEGGEHGTALQAAAFRGNEMIVRILLANGADVHIESGNCGTALWAAAYSGHADVVQLILEKCTGLMGDSKFPEDSTIPSVSIQFELHNQMDVANAARRFHEAVAKGDIPAAQALLNAGVDVNARGGDMSSAWHIAAFDGRSDVLSMLLSQPNPTPDLEDAHGRTPLWLAAAEGHEACVRQFLEFGIVDLTVKSTSGRNMLWFPCWNGHVEIARLLRLRGVDPHQPDLEGTSPLMAAKQRDQSRVVEILST